jgi:aflatoxin B1 aldehyde reductase
MNSFSHFSANMELPFKHTGLYHITHYAHYGIDLTKSVFVHSPLAGGFLTGRMTRGDVAGTRFDPGNIAFKGYSSMYDKPEMHAAITDLQDTIEPLQISGSQACLRWIYYHSMLGNGDGVILGASKISQIVQNVEDVSQGPLPIEVVRKIDSLRKRLVN